MPIRGPSLSLCIRKNGIRNSVKERGVFIIIIMLKKPLLWTVDRMNLGSTSFQTRIFGSQTCLSNGVCVLGAALQDINRP